MCWPKPVPWQKKGEPMNRRLQVGVIAALVGGMASNAAAISAAEPGLLAWYTFDEGAGTALKDLSGNGHDGIVHRADWIRSVRGRGLAFQNADMWTRTKLDLSALPHGMLRMVAAVAVTVAVATDASAQKYAPTWESLDRRPVPGWYADAKFGIFIHWGPYSVPAWAPVGTYSEWYQYWMQNKTCSGNSHPKPTAVYDYHVKTYGKDFSYNRNEDVQDYNSAQALILTLVDTVSHGGNLLLDIGPDGNGKIPPIMQERLLEIGQWLKVNGEAIYGTRKWKTMVQWSGGERLDGQQYRKRKNISYVAGDFVLKQTLYPDPGMAVKEVFFTAKGHDVYAILPKLPEGKLLLKTVVARPSTRVSLLGTGRTFTWQKVDGGIEVFVPPLLAKEVPCQHAWALKLTNAQ